MTIKSYAGIGSRSTPKSILSMMVLIGEGLASLNYTLRSGGAKGADKAFEAGCDKVGGKKEIYLPWSGFEGSDSKLIVKKGDAYKIARKYHPYFDNLGCASKVLQARNSHQVLGKNLNCPTNFILCYTEGGAEKGGTAQALRIARAHSIPVFNFGSYKDDSTAIQAFKQFYKDHIK